jgi:hypothetical protein
MDEIEEEYIEQAVGAREGEQSQCNSIGASKSWPPVTERRKETGAENV